MNNSEMFIIDNRGADEAVDLWNKFLLLTPRSNAVWKAFLAAVWIFRMLDVMCILNF